MITGDDEGATSDLKIHMVIKDLLRGGHIVKDLTTSDIDDLTYEFMLYDRDKYIGFQKQARALLKGRPGFSLIELYPVYNTVYKFGKPIQERFEFEVTLTWVE